MSVRSSPSVDSAQPRHPAADARGHSLAILLVEQNLYSALAVSDEAYVLETGKSCIEAARPICCATGRRWSDSWE
jgi:hypothetical protein